MLTRKHLSLAVALATTFSLQAQDLRNSLEKIVKANKATIGISVLDMETGDTITINNDHHYPMQSVFKFPLAMAILNQVDKGKLKLDQKIHIGPEKMVKNTWSPIRDKYPDGNVDLTLSEIIEYTVSTSDNIGCDLLFEMIGGPKKAQKFIHGLGLKKIAIVANEAAMHKDDKIQYKNWVNPLTYTQMLDGLFKGKYLSKASTRYMMETLIACKTSGNRIRKLLPAGTVVADKTGTSGTNDKGFTAAVNDVGIITLPNGKRFALAVLVSDTYLKTPDCEQIIAEVAKVCYDYFKDKK